MKRDFNQSSLAIRLAKTKGIIACFLLVFSFACKGQQLSQQKPNLPTSKITVEVLPVQNGKIMCKAKNGSTFTSFDDVASGTQLTFTLVPNAGYEPYKLVIDGTEYKTLTVDGLITSEVVVNKSIKVYGECTKKSGIR